MNTANLQLEGLLLALACVFDVLKRRGVLSQKEIAEALDQAEASALADHRRPAEVSSANVDAICFPIRFLREAANRMPGQTQAFTDITSHVGRNKP
jgi:hypothetical protein